MQARWLTVLIIATLLGAAALSSPARAGAQGFDVQYWGGPIMGDPSIYTIFWLPSGQHFEQDPARDTAYEGLITGFIKDLDGSRYLKLLTQYSKDAGGHAIAGGPITGHITLGGTWVDTAPYPHAGTLADPVLANDVKAQIESAMAANGWTPGLHKIYQVFLSEHMNFCVAPDFLCTPSLGGLHFAFSGVPSPLIASTIPDNYGLYLDRGGTPSPARSTGNSYADDPYSLNLIYPMAHELMEIITDPLSGGPGNPPGSLDSAWTQEDGNSLTEIPDLCTEYAADVALGTQAYILPAVYSNAQHGCAYTDPALSVHLRLASRHPLKGKQQTLTVTTAPNARLRLGIQPDGASVVATANANGTYVYRWTPRHATVEVIDVSAATSDGLAGLATAHVTVRRHT